MPIDYSKSKIYMIEPICEYEEGDIYIGSTVRPLSERMNQHRCSKQNICSSKLLFTKYGIGNCKIVLIENFACETKEQLLQKEGEHIRNTKCVNKCIAGRTEKERKKEYYKNNKEHINSYQKQYAEEHQEEKKIYRQNYNEEHKNQRNENKEQKKEYDKLRYLKNKEIKE